MYQVGHCLREYIGKIKYFRLRKYLPDKHRDFTLNASLFVSVNKEIQRINGVGTMIDVELHFIKDILQPRYRNRVFLPLNVWTPTTLPVQLVMESFPGGKVTGT